MVQWDDCFIGMALWFSGMTVSLGWLCTFSENDFVLSIEMDHWCDIISLLMWNLTCVQ